MLSPLLLVLSSYLLGSVPFGLVLGLLRGQDLRSQGSGNIGATNAARVLGRPAGVLVFALDLAKGWAPVVAARHLLEPPGVWPLGCAAAAVCGHVFPVYLRFRGGKGVATGAGAFLGVLPAATLVGFGVWLLVLLATRVVALASLAGAWAVVAAAFLLRPEDADPSEKATPLLLVAVALLITWRHRANLRRLVRGQEPRVRLGSGRRGNEGILG